MGTSYVNALFLKKGKKAFSQVFKKASICFLKKKRKFFPIFFDKKVLLKKKFHKLSLDLY